MFSSRTVALMLCIGFMSGCWVRKVEWMGYVDATRIDVYAPNKGYIENFDLTEGDFVQKDDFLAKITYIPDQLQIDAKRNSIRSELWRLNDLMVGRFQDPGAQDIMALQEKVKLALVDQRRSQLHFDRMDELVTTHAVSQEAWENAIAQKDQADIAYSTAEINLDKALMGASDNIKYAEYYKVQSDLSMLKSMEKAMEDLTIYATTDAFIAAKYTSNGAWVNSGSRVVSIGKTPYFVVFYASAKEVSSLQLGHSVDVMVMNGKKVKAKISKVFEQAVFTPPIVYADGDCDEYRYRVEAIVDGMSIHPGQPVRVIWHKQ